MNNFVKVAVSRGKQINSRLVLAIDLYLERFSDKFKLYEKIQDILSALENYVAGVKIGLPTILSLTTDLVNDLIVGGNWEYFFIADMKIADVGHVSSALLKQAAYMGFNAVISHAAIGYKGALENIVSEAKKHKIGVLTVCAMSHPGAEEIINTVFHRNLEVSLKANVDGFISPATMPKYIRKIREVGVGKLIFSPGVGVQGASPGSAIKAGADFEIVGRAIYEAENPDVQAANILQYLRWE